MDVEDRAGNTALTIWLSNRSHKASDMGVTHDALFRFIGLEPAQKPFSKWGTFERFVSASSVESGELAEAIEASVEREAPEDPYELYCAWKSIIRLKGAFSAKTLRENLSLLRSNASGLWLDLAIVAYSGSIEGFFDVVICLVEENLLSPEEFIERFEAISNTFGAVRANQLVSNLLESLHASNFCAELSEWANEELGLQNTQGAQDFRLNMSAKQDHILVALSNMPMRSQKFGSAVPHE